ncbi:arginine N-succinyltransferase [Neptunomonas qingdaonensis]|uniref:Arginine N-succinyltransferase n=1 Tax=Neptunomonas qingdaonensis TaxID=1045558 RepID=A0A1I2UJR3_9GAMM|nr:arginine N-succinyltransferase [Neptunomonas qingdaonensis]SFG77288.1 arginine N-succinyltransferase [Neptunomonas qingdaonensis]
MLLIRPLTFADLQGLERLAVISGGRMTTLPANRDHLNELINRTRQSLRKEVTQYSDESYHFALEDQTNGEIVGVCGVDASVGMNTPFYSYRVDDVVHASNELQIHNRIPALHLCQDYTGSARLCTLFLDKAHRTTANLNLLSRCRMLFIAQYPERFANKLIAELQGVADSENRSPFWECLGRHFFNMDFNKANYLTGINSKGFIADLMPHYPVYVPLLSAEAQAALGQPRPDMAEVKTLLEAEGFSYRRYVDIFDAGPTLEARTRDIHTVAQNRLTEVKIGNTDATEQPVDVLISNLGRENFRCLITSLDPQHPVITSEVAEALLLSSGDKVRIIRL